MGDERKDAKGGARSKETKRGLNQRGKRGLTKRAKMVLDKVKPG